MLSKKRRLRRSISPHMAACETALASLNDLAKIAREYKDDNLAYLSDYAIYLWLFLADVRTLVSEVNLAETPFEKHFRARMLSIPLYEFVEKDHGKIYRSPREFFQTEPDPELLRVLRSLIDRIKKLRKNDSEFLRDIRVNAAAHRLPKCPELDEHKPLAATIQLETIRQLDLPRLLGIASESTDVVGTLTRLWERAVWRAYDQSAAKSN